MKRHAFPLAVTAVVTSLVLSGCGDDEPTDNADDPASTPASETTEASPTEPTETTTTASAEPTESETSGGTAGTVSVPVFFVGDTPRGPRLFAEQREVEADNPLEEAAALVVSGDAVDPDYRTLFPEGGGFTSIEYDGEKFAVTLADDAWNTPAPGMTKAEAKLAVQQLVYTLQAVEGVEAPIIVLPSGMLFGDAPVVGAADELSTRALVNVTSPAEGATVSDTFTASGEASSFEATVPWEVRDEAGQAVLTGFATAEGWIDGLYPWQSEVDVSELAPGTYTFVAMTDDPSGGAEGAGPTEDTKTIVVE